MDKLSCPKRTYHDFKVIKLLKQANFEQCRYCGYKLVYRQTPAGRVAKPREYQESHIRALAQPTGKYSKIFHKLYGYEPARNLDKYHENQRRRETRRSDLLHDYSAFIKGDRTVV